MVQQRIAQLGIHSVVNLIYHVSGPTKFLIYLTHMTHVKEYLMTLLH